MADGAESLAARAGAEGVGMPAILGTLVIGIASKFIGDFVVSAAKKIFGGADAPASTTAPSFQSTFEGARAQQAAYASAAGPASAVASAAPANFSSASTAAELTIASRRAMLPSRSIIATYLGLNSIQA
jgi:hypothetical protein